MEYTTGFKMIFWKYLINRNGFGNISFNKYNFINLLYLLKFVISGSNPRDCSTILYLFKNLNALSWLVFFASFTCNSPSPLLLNNPNLTSLVFFLWKGLKDLSSSLLVEIMAPFMLQSGNLVIESIFNLFKLDKILNGEMK